MAGLTPISNALLRDPKVRHPHSSKAIKGSAVMLYVIYLRCPLSREQRTEFCQKIRCANATLHPNCPMAVLLLDYANRVSNDANYKSIRDHFIQKVPLSLTSAAVDQEFTQQLQSVLLSKPVTCENDRIMMVFLITGDLVCEAVRAKNIQRASEIFNIPYEMIGFRQTAAPSPYEDFMITTPTLLGWLGIYDTLIDPNRVCDLRVDTAALLPPLPAPPPFPLPIVQAPPVAPAAPPPAPVPMFVLPNVPPAAPPVAPIPIQPANIAPAPPKQKIIKVVQASPVVPKPILPVNIAPAPPKQQIIKVVQAPPAQTPKRLLVVAQTPSSTSEAISQSAKLAKICDKDKQVGAVKIIQPWYKTDPRVTDADKPGTPISEDVIWSYLIGRFTLQTFPNNVLKWFSNKQGQRPSYRATALGVAMTDFGEAVMKAAKFKEIRKCVQTELLLAKDKGKTFKDLLQCHIIPPTDCILYDRVMMAIALTSCMVDECLLKADVDDAFAYYLAATEALSSAKHVRNICSQGWIEMKEIREQLVNRKKFDMLYDERLLNPAAPPPLVLSKAAQNHRDTQITPDVEHYGKAAATRPAPAAPFNPDQFFAMLTDPPAVATDPADATTDPADGGEAFDPDQLFASNKPGPSSAPDPPATETDKSETATAQAEDDEEEDEEVNPDDVVPRGFFDPLDEMFEEENDD